MLKTTWTQRSAYRVAYVDVFSGPAFLWAAAVCCLLRALRKPHVIVLRGGGLPQSIACQSGLLGRLAKGSAAVVTQTGYLARCVARYDAKTRLIPNALDIPRYSFRLRESPRPELIWLRSFHQIYNPSLAVEALALLVDAYPEVHLTMIGPDKGDGSLDAARLAAETLGVADRVRFVDAIPKAEVPVWLEKADIFLSTTDFDNTPVTVEEAMACGLCVVSTKVGGVPYLVDDGVIGLLVPPRDGVAMATAVRRILTEPGLAARLSQQGRTKVEEFDWTRVLPQWQELFLSIGAAPQGDGHELR